MFILLRKMFIEEWRIHSTLLGNLKFALLPVIIMSLGALSSLLAYILNELFSQDILITVAHVSFLFFGMSVGGFGISGQEFMNRRFGQASLLSYSSRSLPISERKIFLSTIIKDIFYYLFIWIFPIMMGFFFMEIILSSPSISILFGSFLSLSLSFMIGLSLVFFLSTIYANSSLLFALMLSFSVFALVVSDNLRYSILSLFNPYQLLSSGEYISISLLMLSIFIFFMASIIFMRPDFQHKINLFDNDYTKISKFFSFTDFKAFITKDYLDLRRSRGGLGKIIFSYAIPVIFIYVFIDFFRENVSPLSFTLLFSLLLGVFSASIYTWITEHDLYMQYIFLPVTKARIIKSKISVFMVLNLVSYILLVFVSFLQQDIQNLLASMIVFSFVSIFSLSLTIFLTGLLPSIRFMDAKVVATYILSIMPVVLLLIFALEFYPIFTIPLLSVLGIISYFLLKNSFKKWESVLENTY